MIRLIVPTGADMRVQHAEQTGPFTDKMIAHSMSNFSVLTYYNYLQSASGSETAPLL